MNSQPVVANVKFVLDGVSEFIVKNITFEGKSGDLFFKVNNVSGKVVCEAIEALKYKNFLNDPGTT